jgi:serine/threonine protein kinase
MKVIQSPEQSDPLVGQVLPGGLKVLERLGGTSERQLYRAQYTQTGSPVALMLLQFPENSRDPSAVSPPPTRLWQQLRRACQIRHPNVASLLEVGKTPGGRVYAVGELLTGQLLSEVLSIRGTVPPAEAVEVCLQVAAGLQAAHGIGVAHGSVSPRTILIPPTEDDRLLVKLIGFDFSWYEADSGRSLDQSADDQYSSPERLAGSAPDEVSDVFSLGAVLHHLLVGTPPREDSAPDSIPPALRRVLDRALASPSQRYPTVAAFAVALTQAAASPGKQKRGRPWRSGWLVASIVSLLVAALLWLGWGRFRVNLGDTSHPQKGAVALKPVGVSKPRLPSAETRESTERRKQPSVSKAPLRPAPSRTSRPEPVETGTVAKSKAADSAPNRSSRSSERRDSGAGPFISPVRRAHPWAAHPDGRSYFPSSCPLALASSELVYFTSEREARATGRSRSNAPGCS